MAQTKSWVLTDVRKNVWVEKSFLGHEELGVPNCTAAKHLLRGGLRDGVDLIEITNGDLSFSVLPTRGMGIWKGEYKGLALGWEAPVRGPVHPKFVNLHDRAGLGWLMGFDELLCRCGLDSNGAPGEDVVIDNHGNKRSVMLTLHGRIANLPAHRVEIHADPGSNRIAVVGEVDESALFYPGLRLRTTIATTSNSNRIAVTDEIINLKGTPSEMQILYHWNLGPPFLEGGSKLLAPAIEAAPRDPRAAEGVKEMGTYLAPTAGYVEQVYYYDLAASSDGGRTLAALRNAAGDRAVALRWSKAQLPCFTQWKNTAAAADGYTTGLEPGTNYPNVKKFERERGRVVRLDPGKSHRVEQVLEVLNTREQVAALEAEIAALQGGKPPTVHPRPIGKLSPV